MRCGNSERLAVTLRSYLEGAFEEASTTQRRVRMRDITSNYYWKVIGVTGELAGLLGCLGGGAAQALTVQASAATPVVGGKATIVASARTLLEADRPVGNRRHSKTSANLP